jgi:hypothetical protein
MKILSISKTSISLENYAKIKRYLEYEDGQYLFENFFLPAGNFS